MRPRGPVLGVGAIVVRGGSEVLLVRRGVEPFRGQWSFPGGHVEPGEPLLEAARRELQEETGVEAEPLGIIHVHELLAEGPGGVPHHYVIIDVLMRYLGGEARAGSDAAEAAWFSLDRLPLSEMTPGARRVAERLREMLGGCLLVPMRTVCL